MTSRPQQRLQYLESLDSVRLTHPSACENAAIRDQKREEYNELQVFLEVLVTLAMGRVIVVPQSYAFDSWAFLSVAERVLDARATLSSSADRPFRLHVHGAGVATYDDAVQVMLARVHDPCRPFASSLFPELSTLDPGEVARLAYDLDRLLTWVDDDVARPMEKVRDEFRTLRPVAAQPPRRAVTLDELLVQLVDPSSAMSRASGGLDQPAQAVHRTLVEAVRRLNSTSSSSFGQRSSLRRAAPWPNDPSGRSPSEIVGGDEPLALVTEFVDTLYNRVIVESIGIASATFSTSMALGEELQRTRAVAQRLAVSSFDSLGVSGNLDDDLDPLFEVRINPDTVHAHISQQKETARLFKRVDILLPLLEARSQSREVAHPSPFWAGVHRLDLAVLEGDENEARRALESHIKMVATLLGGRATVGLTSRWEVQMALTGIGATAPYVATSSWQLPGILGLGLTAAGAIAPAVVQKTTATTRRLRADRRLASALGEFVGIYAGDGAAGAP